MARGHVERVEGEEFRLISPHPLVEALPGIYREAWIDDRAQVPGLEPFGPRFLGAFDELLAPFIASIDTIDAYLDPATTPSDFLTWLGEWVAATVDETWSVERRRAFVAQAADLYRRRGTPGGLRDHVEVHTGGSVQVIDNGACTWSAKAGGELPGTVQPLVVVKVTVDDPSKVDRAKLMMLVQGAKPAHVPHRVDVVGAATQKAGPGPAVAPKSPVVKPPAGKPPATKPPTPKPPTEGGSP